MGIKAVIFDMDGLLIDSEPLWRRSFREVFAAHSIDIPEHDEDDTTGMRVDLNVQYLYELAPWKGPTVSHITAEIIDRVVELVLSEGKQKPGVVEVIKFLVEKNIPLSIASSSPLRMIEAVSVKFNIQNDITIYHSAEFEIEGKPHPAVYLATAKKLSARPDECLAFEDSFNGLKSAKAAGMKCVLVPDVFFKGDKQIADLVISRLDLFDEEKFKALNDN